MLTTLAACPVCGSAKSRPFLQSDHRTIVQCLGCGHGWATTFDAAELDRHYREDYYSSPEDPRIQSWIDNNMPVWRRLAAHLHLVKSPIGSLLDVGAGTGGFLIAAHDTFPEIHFHAVESSAAAREHLRRRLPGLTFPVDDAEHLDQDGATYDAITLLQVLEHVANPLKLCRDIRGRMNPGGVFLLTIPNRHSYERIAKPIAQTYCFSNPTHLHFFSRRSAVLLLQKAGFERIVRMVNYDGSHWFSPRALAQWLLRRAAISTELRFAAFKN
jgi:2-polyprenyl-3-methyl-5-hydroxy-6-metoxy-1,4-benzoquinol methylase